MKHLFIIFLLLVVSSCQSPAPILPSDKGETTRLTLGVGGDEFLLSSSSDDLLALQIYSYDKDGVKSPYAYGLFDNFSIGDLVLAVDSEYSIEATFVRGAKNRIAHSSAQKYSAPFMLSPNFTAAVTNCFTQSSSYFFGLMSGECKLQNGTTSEDYTRALLERYAGSTGVFSVNENSDISLSLKRVYTTLRLSTEGVSSGVFTLQIDGAEPIVYNVEQGSVDYTVSLAGSTPSSTEWMADGYSEEAEYQLFFDGGSGARLVSSGAMELVRSKVLPINMSMDSKSVSVDLESTEMEVLPPLEIVL